jgi:hypothetical protein
MLIDKQLKFKSYNSYESSRYVGIPPTGMQIQDDFDTLWQVVFTLSSEVRSSKEIWMVQDQNEARTTTMLMGMLSPSDA